MITNVSLVTIYCLDQDKARDFYVDVLGFTPRTDISMGEGFRWVTVGHPSQLELEITLMTPGPPLDDESAAFVRRQLERGQQGGLGLSVDDCRKTFEELSAKGVEFLQEPSERPYGVEAVLRDVSGNWLVLVERREFSPSDSPERATPLPERAGRCRRRRRPAGPGAARARPWSRGRSGVRPRR